ncbi:DUF2927 domain-containing protein [Ketogulonicigenium vulgare]|uniref:Lipoprotein, putative n=2 Tax=Ketogulonicigenium vulgare TaxID=92945 RepID=F9YAJ4_KETVW|nr:DUF2927 domain-containing protein [Ketogulonicigenium vulgare]AEM41525.1 Lipoprotein, putative [Ketogulonicigenium vulgare WSH-001]
MMRPTRHRLMTWTAGLCALSLLIGCAEEQPVPEAEAPRAISPRERPVQAEVVALPSATSQALAQYYVRLQNDLRGRGLLRTDDGHDAPFTDTVLARNFIRVALFDEYTDLGHRFAARASESHLRRWEQPIRMQTVFGATVPLEQRQTDRAEVTAYAARLAEISGLSITPNASDPNYLVIFAGEDDRSSFAPMLRQFIPGISDSAMLALMNPDRSTLCLVVAFGETGQSNTYTRAIALIRGEHPQLIRSACINEELAQGLGLANDDMMVRPSIFNDSEEFALLTTHDALLLKMLYDPRLRPGMTIDEATPIVNQIATELMTVPPA